MKKTIALIMAFVMVAAMFAGCGGNAGSSNTIKIGMTGPLTGGAAVYGTAVKAGMEIAVEEINALGGLQFELNCQDDQHDIETAANAYYALKDWNMQIFAGTVTSDPAKTVAPLCVEDNIFMLTPSASADAILDAGSNVFQVCFKDSNQGTASANYFLKHFPDAKIGVIYDSSDPYSAGIYATFAAQAEENGLDVVCAEAFTADNKSNLNTQVDTCKEKGADLVFLPFYCQEASLVLTYANDIGYEPTFFSCDGMDGILAIEGFDPALAEGVMLLTPFSADAEDQKTQDFVAKYQEKTGIIPNQFAADAYDVIYALYAACTEGGVTPDMTSEEISAILVEQFTTMSFDGLTGAGMTWDASGAVSKEPMAVVIENGIYVGVE